jgi:hypothetical protein
MSSSESSTQSTTWETRGSVLPRPSSSNIKTFQKAFKKENKLDFKSFFFW